MQKAVVLATVGLVLLVGAALVGRPPAGAVDERTVVVQIGSDEDTCRGQVDAQGRVTWTFDRGPSGECDRIVAADPADLDGLKPGQTLVIHGDPIASGR